MTDLTGKGKPFHSALDKAAALLKRKVGTGAEFMKELQGLGGIKQAEMDERKLMEIMGMPRMTHDQFMANLAMRPAAAIQEKVLGDVVDKNMVKAIAKEIAYEQAMEELRDEGMSRSTAEDVAKDMAEENYTEYMDEAMREANKGSTAPYHEKWTMPGGENYREMLIKAPEVKRYWAEKYGGPRELFSDPDEASRYAGSSGQAGKVEGAPEQFQGVSHHFGGEPGILASMRLKDRLIPDLEGPHNVKIIGGGGTSNKKFKTRAEAEAFADVKHQGGYRTELTPLEQKKLLHLEELQSDWHQQGRERGYGKVQRNEYEAVQPNGQLVRSFRDKDEAEAFAKERGLILNEIPFTVDTGIPDAPFKKNWEEMALKRLVHHAAEKGYHGIVVTPGEEQADRYSLAKHISGVDYIPDAERPHRNEMIAYDPKGNVIFNEYGMTPEKLAQHIGKEAAQKLLAQEAQPNKSGRPTHSLRGEQLVVGDKAMKRFYDEKVPNILNAIGKKHKVKTQLHGHTIQGRGRERTEEEFREATANVPFERHKEFDYMPKPIPLHHFPITEDMRKDILTNGLPLYAEGGIIKKAQGGTVLPTLEQMRMELMKKAKPDFNDLRNIGINEAPGLNIKAYVPPARDGGGHFPVGGVSMDGQPLPMGGVDLNKAQPGNQLMPANLAQPAPQAPQGMPPGAPSPLGGVDTNAPTPQGGSNILQLTPQGQAMSAMKPQGMATGGGVQNINQPFHTADDKPVPFMMKAGGSYDMPMDNQSMDNGATTFNIDNIQELASGGDVQGYKERGYVHHTDINPHPLAGQRYKTEGHEEGLAPINHVDVESMMGGSFGIAPWDTSGSHRVTSVSGHDLINPVQLEAGQNFPRMLRNIAVGRGGASGRKVVEGQQERISRAISHNLGNKGTGKVYTSPSTMKAETSSNFSHMPIEIQLDLMHQAGLSMKEIQELNNQVKALKGMENFVGFEDPNLWEHITAGDERKVKSIAQVRKAMTKVLASKENQQRMNYNFEDLVGAITDPDLRGVPMNYTGRVLLEGHPNEVSGSPFMDPGHTSYSTGHRQKYVGGSHNAPVELWMPDSFEQEKARLLKKNPKLKTNPNLRSQTINSLAWTKEPVGYQPINERVVRNIKRFEEGIKAGDINPNDLAGVLDYFSRKHKGYKKGGKVKMSDNMDTINLELLNKRKKAK